MKEMMVVKRQETRDLRPRGDTGGRNGERARGEANRSTRDRLHSTLFYIYLTFTRAGDVPGP